MTSKFEFDILESGNQQCYFKWPQGIFQPSAKFKDNGAFHSLKLNLNSNIID